MSIDKKDKASPDLEAIARKYAMLEEDNELSQIVDRGVNALQSMKFKDGSTFVYTDKKNGSIIYKQDLSDTQKEELANALAKSLTYHAYIRQYGMHPKDLDGFFNAKSKSGRYMSDSVLESEFETSRYLIKKKLEGMDKITTGSVAAMFDGFMKKQVEKISISLNTELSEAKPDAIKKFIKKTMDKYGSPANNEKLYGELDKAYSSQDLIGLYLQTVEYHKPAKAKKK